MKEDKNKFTIQELGGLGKADVEAVSGESVSKVMLKAVNSKLVFDQLFKNEELPNGFSSGVVPNAPTTALTINVNIGAGNSLSESGYTYNGTTVTPIKNGLYIAIDNESIKVSSNPLMNNLVNEMSSALAREMDKEASTVLLGITAVTLTTFTDGTIGACSTPVLEIVSVNGGTIASVDYEKGSIILDASIPSTITYTYSSVANGTGYHMASTSAKTISIKDVLTMRGSLNANSIHPDVLIINDIDVTNFVYDTQTDGLISYSKDARYNGEIASLLDLSILTSDLLPQGIAVLVDSSRSGYSITGNRGKVFSTVQDKLDLDQKHLRVYSEVGYSLGDTKSVGIITNGQTNGVNL